MSDNNESNIPPTPSSSGSSSAPRRRGPTTPETGRNFEFLVSGTAQRPEGEDRSIIRRAVMRNFFDDKRRGSDTESSSEQVSTSTAMSRPKLTSRLRLSKDGKELVETRKRRRKSASEKVDAGQRRGSEMQGAGTGIEDSLSRMHIPDAEGVLQNTELDPLPMMTEELNAMYDKGTWLCSGITVDDSDWWSFVPSDDAVDYAAFANWNLYAATLTGDHNWHIQAMKAKDTAIKNLNAKLSGRAGDVSDDLIGTVMLGANFENLLGAYDASELHIGALKRMLDVRGGFGAFVHTDGLLKGMTWLKGLTWVDFHYATAHRQSPGFRRVYLDGIPPFPAELLQEAAREPPISFSGLSFWVAELHDILSRLRQLALAASPPAQWAERLDRRTTCYLLYEMEYLALSIPDLSQEFRSYDIGLPMIGQYTDSFSANSEKMHADDASIVEALVASVQTFVFAAVRGVPPKARIFQILLERLKRALDRRDTDVTEIWRRRNGLQVLLWIHVVAYSVARHGGDGGWWVEQLAELVGELGVYSEEDWRMRLGRVAWIESYFKDVLEELRADANVHLDDLYGNRGAGIGDSGVTEDLVTPSLPEEMFDPSAFELDDSREW